MHIEISTRHGELTPEQHRHIEEKAGKLPKYFDRLMEINVAVERDKHAWKVEILVSAEHKHDFVAVHEGETPESAMDQCVRRVEEQIRRYKERVQHHKGDPTQRGMEIVSPESD